jgi:hypothetical protein
VSPQGIVALTRRHRVGVVTVLVLAACLAYGLEHSAPGYSDSATVAFTAPGADLFSHQSGLLVIDALTADSVMSETGHQQVRAAGGTAHYNVALVNLNDEDYPNYSDPYVTVTTTSPSPSAAQRTFSAVMQVLRHDLAAMQEQQAAKPATWIQARTIAAPSGPVAQGGSRKRTLAALAVLALIATFMTAAFLDRHSIRPRRLLRRTGAGPVAARGGWRAGKVHPGAD